LPPLLAPVLGAIVAVDDERAPRGVTLLPSCMKIVLESDTSFRKARVTFLLPKL
jgi:hypothetical protein